MNIKGEMFVIHDYDVIHKFAYLAEFITLELDTNNEFLDVVKEKEKAGR